jgi:hypothetical protein
MPHFETIAEEAYRVDKKYNIKTCGQKGAEEEDESALEKDLMEDSAEKASIKDLLIDNLNTQLNLSENYKILDEIVGESVRTNLSRKLIVYTKRLLDDHNKKNIVPNNSVKDIVNNLGDALFLDISRLKKTEMGKIIKKGGVEKKEEHKKYILKEFMALDDYIAMLLSNDSFERMELADPFGYMKKQIKNEDDKKRLEFLRVNQVAFVEEIKKTLSNN